MLRWLSLDASSSTFTCPWLSSSFSSWHSLKSSQVSFSVSFYNMHCQFFFLTKKLETVPGTNFIRRTSIPYWTHSIHRSMFIFPRRLLFSSFGDSFSTILKDQRIIYLSYLIASATCEYWYDLSLLISQMPLQLLLIPHYSISFLKLSNIIHHRLFGV